MLRLIESGFFGGCHEKVRDEILAKTLSGERSFLIVPEQQTVSAEREFADLLPPSSPLIFDVTNFTRFANTVFRALGGLSGEVINGSKKALFMWRALNELLPVLKSFGASREINPGAVKKMVGAVSQMQSLSLSPSELKDAKSNLCGIGDERLTSKLDDIAEIMTLYKKLISEHFQDSEELLEEAGARLTASGRDFLSGVKIYIDGFTSFTEPQYKLIRALISMCDVTVSLGLPRHTADAFEYSELKRAHLRLLRIANVANQEASLERCDPSEKARGLIPEIVENLWRSRGKIDTDTLIEADKIRIFEASDPHDECDFIANDIKRRVMEEGAKYSDFGVIARSIESYEGIIDVSFNKAGIPLFISSRADVMSFEAIKLIFSALAVIRGGYSRRDVISYAKCSLSGVGRALVDELEIYAEKWQINGRRFTDGVMWNMNPRGYTSRRDTGAAEKLLRIDEARRAVIEPLRLLEGELSGERTVREYAEALVSFLVSLDIERQLRIKSEEATALTESDSGAAIGKLWKMICDSLDSLSEVTGDIRVSLDTFANLLSITFSEADIGRIPAFAEQVQAGSAATSRMYGKRHIYVIGSAAGEFPASVDDDSYFTDAEKKALSDAGLAIEADTDLRSARELYYYQRALSFASESVTVTYSAEDTSFTALRPSDAIARIVSLSGGAIKVKKTSELSGRERAYSSEYAIEHLRTLGQDTSLTEALKDIGLGEKLNISNRPIKNTGLRLGKEALDSLYDKTVRMDQTKLEKYIGCPLSYFCDVNLKLGTDDRVDFDNRNIGTFVHSILECFFSELKKRGSHISEITDGEKDELIRKVATDYINEAFAGMDSTPARLKSTLDNLCRASRPVIDSLADEFSDCEYEPIFFELDIDKYSPDSPEPSVFKTDDGRRVYFAGKIDRVDTFESDGDVYVRVVDYKTGAKKFSPDDIAEGKNLQMFLYLKAVTESKKASFRERIGVDPEGDLIPAGVIYVKASVVSPKISRNSPDTAREIAKKSQEREGMLLYDPVSLSAMNSAFIPIKFKKDGDPDSRSAAKLYTPEGWDEINETMERVVTEKCDDILSGNIAATPLLEKGGKASACKYCKFKPICRNASLAKETQ